MAYRVRGKMLVKRQFHDTQYANMLYITIFFLTLFWKRHDIWSRAANCSMQTVQQHPLYKWPTSVRWRNRHTRFRFRDTSMFSEMICQFLSFVQMSTDNNWFILTFQTFHSDLILLLATSVIETDATIAI